MNEDWMDDEYRAFGPSLDGPEYEPEKNPNHKDLPMPAREPTPEPVHYTQDELRENRIRKGECPQVACHGRLDATFYCSSCHVRSLPRSVAAFRDGTAVTEAPFDEFAPAQVEQA